MEEIVLNIIIHAGNAKAKLYEAIGNCHEVRQGVEQSILGVNRSKNHLFSFSSKSNKDICAICSFVGFIL